MLVRPDYTDKISGKFQDLGPDTGQAVAEINSFDLGFTRKMSMVKGRFAIRHEHWSDEKPEDVEVWKVACNHLETRLSDRLSAHDPNVLVQRDSLKHCEEFQVQSQALDTHLVLETILEDLDTLDLLQWAERISTH